MRLQDAVKPGRNAPIELYFQHGKARDTGAPAGIVRWEQNIGRLPDKPLVKRNAKILIVVAVIRPPDIIALPLTTMALPE